MDRRKACLAALLLVASLMIILPIHLAAAQTATISVSPSASTVTVGQTLIVHVEISNIQNLYGVDIALTWNTSMLTLVSNQSFVGVSNGILNAPIIEVQDTASQATGEYNLIASSENPAGPWSGSATVATLTFNVTNNGQSALTLESSSTSSPQLASYPQPGTGAVSQPISVSVDNGQVTTYSSSNSPSPASSSSSPSTSTSSSASSSPGTSSSTSTPKVPEVPALLILPFLIVGLFLMAAQRLRKKGVKNSFYSKFEI